MRKVLISLSACITSLTISSRLVAIPQVYFDNESLGYEDKTLDSLISYINQFDDIMFNHGRRL